MSLVNNSANNFKDFLDAIKPYLNYQFYDLSGQGVEANNFSTDEKVIGTWVDGKPLYQKTIDCGTLPNASDKYVDTGVTNVKDVIFSIGMAYNSDHTGKIVLPRILKDNADIMYSFTSDLSRIRIITESNRSSVYAYITLQYIKTTDSAVASGEKIVGQWVDGKPLYEKTYVSDTFNYDQTYSDLSLFTISNVDKVIRYNGVVSNSSKTNFYNLPWMRNGDKYAYLEYKNGTMYFNSNEEWGINGYIQTTIQYTKTS